MLPFHYRDGALYAEDVPCAQLIKRFGTPTYLYSRRALEEAWRTYERAFSGSRHLICYAVKANSNLAILNLLARLGSGFDIVSVGELRRVVCAGGDPGKVVFSGIGKTAAEIQTALELGIKCFNVESCAELQRINGIAEQMGRRGPVSIRVNPDIDAGTHPYITTGIRESKFGIAFEEALPLYEYAAGLGQIDIVGVDCHIGSQITRIAPFLEAIERLMYLVERLEAKGIAIQHIDVGGGLGIDYQGAEQPMIEDYVRGVRSAVGTGRYTILVEPGRSIVGHAGILLTRVEYIKTTKERNFAIVDAAMNDLIRPALYGSEHAIKNITQSHQAERVYDVVGPICETSDVFARNKRLALAQNDVLALCDVGAYGFTMSSHYNSRPRACEVMVDRDRPFEIRSRETVETMMAMEKTLEGAGAALD